MPRNSEFVSYVDLSACSKLRSIYAHEENGMDIGKGPTHRQVTTILRRKEMWNIFRPINGDECTLWLVPKQSKGLCEERKTGRHIHEEQDGDDEVWNE